MIFAQDHTHEVTKNYYQRKRIEATALWDVATETGEIAAAVLVPSTKTIHFAHAAAQLSKRPSFTPKVRCSDTWPTKNEHWEHLLGQQMQGQLGLFHCVQRMTRTLKKKHPDHFVVVNALLRCTCRHNEEDYENLLKALKEGTLVSKKHTTDEIMELKSTKLFRQRHDRCL